LNIAPESGFRAVFGETEMTKGARDSGDKRLDGVSPHRFTVFVGAYPVQGWHGGFA